MSHCISDGTDTFIDDSKSVNFNVPEHFLDTPVVTADRSTNECLLPHSTIHVAFAISFLIMLLSSVFIYFFAAEFGPDRTYRWMLALTPFFLRAVNFCTKYPLGITFFLIVSS